MKHKNFFLEQNRNNWLCNEVLDFLKHQYIGFERVNTSFVKQIHSVNKRVHIDCTEYNRNVAKTLIELSFKCESAGLVDSINYVMKQISWCLEANENHFYLYNILNMLLRVEFYT